VILSVGLRRRGRIDLCGVRSARRCHRWNGRGARRCGDAGNRIRSHRGIWRCRHQGRASRHHGRRRAGQTGL